MAEIHKQRMTAEIEGDFVVFLIGMRINKRWKVSVATGDVGIWHETYRIAPGQYEAIYGAMPEFGLGKVGRLVPAAGARESARGRMAAPSAVSSA